MTNRNKMRGLRETPSIQVQYAGYLLFTFHTNFYNLRLPSEGRSYRLASARKIAVIFYFPGSVICRNLGDSYRVFKITTALIISVENGAQAR